VAKRLRAGPDKIRHWITSGRLRALNISANNLVKPRFVILPEDLRDFEQRLQVKPPVRPTRRRKSLPKGKDYLSDLPA
jgi:hypothetical protein